MFNMQKVQKLQQEIINLDTKNHDLHRIISDLNHQIIKLNRRYFPESLASWDEAIGHFNALHNHELICHPEVFNDIMNLSTYPYFSDEINMTLFGMKIIKDPNCKGWYFQEKTAMNSDPDKCNKCQSIHEVHFRDNFEYICDECVKGGK